MRSTISSASALSAAIAILTFPLTTLASTLNDWEPRLTNLNTRCKAVYTTSIPNCSAADFRSKNAICSKACLAGLQEITAKVQMACGDEDFGNSTEAENILVCFLAGNGPGRVCPNNPVSSESTTVAGETTTLKTSSQLETSMTMSSSSKPETSKTSSGEGAMTSTTTTTTTSATPTTTTPLNSTTTTTGRSSSSTPTPRNSADVQNQGSSGGGSPFDDTSSSSSNGIIIFQPSIGAMLLAAIFLALGLR